MSFALDVLADKPLALYMLDDTTPLQDHSGYARTATNTGTVTKYTSLVRGAAYASTFLTGVIGTFASPVFKQGEESQPFTLEVVARSALNSSVEQQILGNVGQMDGITIKGTVIYFTTKFLTAPAAVLSYDMQVHGRVHITAVHTKDKNSLFIDGVLVDEVSLTEAQQADKFAVAGGSLSAGTTAGTGQVALNAISIYGYALDGNAVARHYRAGIFRNSPAEVSYSFGAEIIPVTIDTAKTFSQTWDSAEKWYTGDLRGVAVDGDDLVPLFTNDVSDAGYWMGNFAFPTNVTSIYGVTVDWDGVGAVVEVSLNGTSWTTVTRGIKTPLVPNAFNPTNKVLMVRVSFPGGITNDESFTSRLNITGLLANTLTSAAGRTVTLTNASPLKDKPHYELSDGWGISIPTGGNAVISADTSAEALPARTLELWINNGAGGTSSVAGTGYVNGAPGTLVAGKWTLYHVVAAANITGTITLTGPMQVGHVAMYDRALSAAEIASIYAAHTDTNVLRTTDTTTISVSEGTAPVKIYAHDWSIQSAT